MTESFEKEGYGQLGCKNAANLSWNPPPGHKFRWGFLRVEVAVVESKLEGPVDLGDMVVEEGGGECGRKGTGGAKGARPAVGGGGEERVEDAQEAQEDQEGLEARGQPDKLPALVEESEEEMSEEE